MELERVVRQVLVDDWDPLSVRTRPELHSRYDCQVQDLTLLLLGGAPGDELGAYLRTAEQERMGATEVDEARLRRVVARLERLSTRDASGGGDASEQAVRARKT